jgi:hypothetical protein
MKGFPHETPKPSYVTDYQAGVVVIPVAPGVVVSTAPAIKGGDVPKKIEFTVALGWEVAPDSIAIECLKDSVPLTEVWGVDNPNVGGPAPMTTTYSFHWVDETPGKGAPVYSIRMTASAGGGSGVAFRRVTAFNL